MSTKKTIQINPELFKLPGGKTRKNRPNKELTIKPVINPNSLKNKLLKRIKEHKTKELNENKTNSNTNSETPTYTDEFYGAIDYLSDLTKKQKQQKALQNKTLKNTFTSPININTNQISLELPPELTEPSLIQSNEVFNVNYKLNDDIPYGCLKNGKKKTYREWKELTNPINFTLPSLVRPPTPPKQSTSIINQSQNQSQSIESNSVISREQRLEQIKNKLKQIEEQETASKTESLKILEKEIYGGGNLEDLPNFEDKVSDSPDIEDLIREREKKIEKETPKQFKKKTVKRKFTLGKSDKLRRVAVLIKNKTARKNVIDAQRKLKKTNITDVRRHLNQQGLIKVGSTCPADIQRKIFETAMLAGDITNINKETLLHNFLNADKMK